MRLASVVASLLKRLSVVETAADHRTETLEEELCLGAVLDDPSCSMNQYQHEKKKKATLNLLLVFPLFWNVLVKRPSG